MEAEVPVLMLRGLSLDQVAGERRISLGTARDYWQTAVLKVGAPHEELAVLLAPGAAALTTGGRGNRPWA